MYRNTCIYLFSKLCRISSKVKSCIFSPGEGGNYFGRLKMDLISSISSLLLKWTRILIIIRAAGCLTNIEELKVFVRSRGKFQTPQSYVMLTLRIAVITLPSFHKKIKLCSSTFPNSSPADKLLSKHVTFSNTLSQLESQCCGKTRNKNSKSVVYMTSHCVSYYSSIRIFVCVFPTSIWEKKFRETLCVIATNFEIQLIEDISKWHFEEVIEGLVIPNDIYSIQGRACLTTHDPHLRYFHHRFS